MEVAPTLTTPFALSGSIHCTMTVLELTDRPRMPCGGLVGAGRIIHYLELQEILTLACNHPMMGKVLKDVVRKKKHRSCSAEPEPRC